MNTNEYKITASTLAQEIHKAGTANIMASIGIGAEYLTIGRRTACPVCKEGNDRYAFKDSSPQVAGFCTKCRSMDAITIVMKSFNLTFTDTLKRLHRAIHGSPQYMQQSKVNRTSSASNIDWNKRKIQIQRMEKYSSRMPNKEGLAYLNGRGLNFMNKSKKLDNIQYGKSAYFLPKHGALKENGKFMQFSTMTGFLRVLGNPHAVIAIQIYTDIDKVIQATMANGYDPMTIVKKPYYKAAKNTDGAGVWFSNKISREIHIGEGIETMLCVAAMNKTRSVCATGDANRLAKLFVPNGVELVTIWKDHDKTQAYGSNAANDAVEKFRVNNKHVDITVKEPRNVGEDWLDVFTKNEVKRR